MSASASFLTAVSVALSGIALGYLWGSGKFNPWNTFSRLFSGGTGTSRAGGKQGRGRAEDSRTPSVLLRRQVLSSLEKAFRVSKADLEIICDAFIKELSGGLVCSKHDLLEDATEEQKLAASTLPMLPSYVDRLPSGDESGVFLAVDFGGTHVRIIKVTMDENAMVMGEKQSSTGTLPSKFRLIQSKVIIPDELKHGSGYVLFDYIADGVVSFLQQHPIFSSNAQKRHATMPQHARSNKNSFTQTQHQKSPSFSSDDSPLIPLGFTFSFPVQQTALDRGTILRWNKDFKCDDVLEKDPVQLLQASLSKKGVSNVKVVALVNDTVGTLVAHAYEHPQAMIGLILGTGANACYIERYDRVTKMISKNKDAHLSHMVMNTEFGAFNPDAHTVANGTQRKRILPRTKYDEIVDKNSLNQGGQVYEKLISGYYMGEIVRLVLMELIEDGKLFSDATWKEIPEDQGKSQSRRNSSSDQFNSKYGILARPHTFDTSYMSRIERDHSTELADTKSVLEDTFEIYDTNPSDRQLVKFVCELVAIRSARLSAAIIAGIVAHLGLSKLLLHIRNPSLAPSTTLASPATLLHTPCSTSTHDNVVVAIDGSLFEFYPHYGNRMMDALRELFGARADSIQLSLAKDGSGLGAALIAALSVHKAHGTPLVDIESNKEPSDSDPNAQKEQSISFKAHTKSESQNQQSVLA
jgi:hexokinase